MFLTLLFPTKIKTHLHFFPFLSFPRLAYLSFLNTKLHQNQQITFQLKFLIL
uniref:Uncharacterized protein n=1 Tax=Meloidogyne enterolobii TaxID=390850 RepID=A0A6V7UEK2_MELEN|nr:unnamed protein product [Meloidogyne enterolobii]